MSTKEQIIQEVDHLSQPLLEEVLEFVRPLKIKHPPKGKAFKAYLE